MKTMMEPNERKSENNYSASTTRNTQWRERKTNNKSSKNIMLINTRTHSKIELFTH